MADIYFYQDDIDEDSESGFSDSYNACDNPDEGLSSIAKLEKYSASENIFNRQMVARTVLDTLRQLIDDGSDVLAVFQVILRLSEDVEPSVRAELMEQVPHIAMYCHQLPEMANLHSVVAIHLIPLVVRFLTDTNNQVRKTSQAALLVLLEQGLVEADDVDAQVCPVILNLTEPHSLDDYRTEAVALLSKMAPLLGQDMCNRIFLHRFASLCSDPLFHVRKVCAANFGDFSGVVGPESTEETLLPVFVSLCEDGVWGVRKACADVFMPVSCVCSPKIRQEELSPIFINLLRDQSRWVRMAAFQALGPFISTFADPDITALLHNENGEIVIINTDLLVEKLLRIEEERETSHEAETHVSNNNTDKDDKKNDNVVEMETEEDDWTSELMVTSSTSPEETRAEKYLSTRDPEPSVPDSDYSTFLFWREPVQCLNLTDVDLAEDLFDNINLDDENSNNEGPDDSTTTTIVEEKTDDSTEETEHCKAQETGNDLTDEDDQYKPSQEVYKIDPETGISTFDPSSSSLWLPSPAGEDAPVRSRPRTLEDLDPPDPTLPQGPPIIAQNIVPQLLIDHFVSMTDPSRAQTVDNDIARHCAFSLPAVVLTLGRRNWPLLRETYENLANDMQWKVRRTLASSIHELGVILGQELVATDLVPIFNGFIKDLDEVRIGILKHLAEFLKLLSPNHRAEYLPRLEEFLKMDNERNWRFRLELSDQLAVMVALVSPEDLRYHLAPIALSLVQDRVSSVRQSAVSVISRMLTSLNDGGHHHQHHARDIISDLSENLAQSKHWTQRQTFAELCSALVTVIPYDQFSQLLLPHLLDLTWDVVPNVRLKVANIFGFSLPLHHYEDRSSPNFDLIQQSLTTLAADKDNDVRDAACQTGRVEPCPPPKEVHEQSEERTDTAEDEPEEEEEEAPTNPTWAQIVETLPTPSTEIED